MAMLEKKSNCDYNEDVEENQSKKVYKRGIIFLSTIPKFINVTKIREIFERYGEVDRIFLQPEEQKGNKKNKNQPAKHFTEGWIEFKKKKVAKQVAATLNNKQIADRKRSKFYDFIWNIKYLSGFKWAHLSERLAYERAVRKQRMRAEISQAKREANFFAHNVDVSERLAKKKHKKETTSSDSTVSAGLQEDKILYMRQFRQRETDSEIVEKKLKKLSSASSNIKKKKVAHKNPSGPLDEDSRKELLKSLFGPKA